MVTAALSPHATRHAQLDSNSAAGLSCIRPAVVAIPVPIPTTVPASAVLAPARAWRCAAAGARPLPRPQRRRKRSPSHAAAPVSAVPVRSRASRRKDGPAARRDDHRHLPPVACPCADGGRHRKLMPTLLLLGRRKSRGSVVVESDAVVDVPVPPSCAPCAGAAAPRSAPAPSTAPAARTAAAAAALLLPRLPRNVRVPPARARHCRRGHVLLQPCPLLLQAVLLPL